MNFAMQTPINILRFAMSFDLRVGWCETTDPPGRLPLFTFGAVT